MEEQWAHEGLRLNLNEAKQDLRRIFDLTTQVRRHPVVALLAAVAGGFALSGPLGQIVRRHGGALATLAVGSKALKGFVTSKLIAQVMSSLPFADKSRANHSRDPWRRLVDSLQL